MAFTDDATSPVGRDSTELQAAHAPGPRPSGRFTPGAMLAGRFRIVALLGKGGMGEVYRAEDVKLGQHVALKFLPQATALDPVRLRHLYREVRLGRQVSHPNVCRIYDVVEWQEHHFISMEYIDGEDLASLLRRIGKLPPSKALDITREICAGLAAIHGIGIIHRDLKPANVMIDGRGMARITDFGLAEILDDVDRRDVAGTPCYMAPEQLIGTDVTPKADLYALGLIFYEMFTGRRRFNAGSLADALREHENARASSVSQELKEADTAVQRVILRCLEERPDLRPPSVHSIIASLPGGDPLQAAVDAGDTPSPEMVAAAGASGELRPGVAWSLLIGVFVVLLAAAELTSRTILAARVSIPRKIDVLVERSRDLLSGEGYARPAIDSAADVSWNQDYFGRGGVQHGHVATELEKRINDVKPAPVLFHYRQSPSELWPVSSATRGGGKVTADDPPLSEPGMASIDLDPAGRLVRFAVVPPKVEDPPRKRTEVDWSRLLAATGIDRATLGAAAPRWSAPVDRDERFAWRGEYAGQPGVPIQIEAGSYHGRPTWLWVIPPWQKVDPARPPASGGAGAAVQAAFGITLLVCLMAGGFFLARRNVLRGRMHRDGVIRFGAFSFLLYFVSTSLDVHHVWSGLEVVRLLDVLDLALVVTALLLMWYVAIEPYFRRRFPRMLIGWTRLLSGRLKDPMVGRDILIGVFAGLVCATVEFINLLAPAWLGRPPLAGLRTGWDFAGLTGLSAIVHFIVFSVGSSIGRTLIFAVLFLVFRIVSRSTTAATVLLVVAAFLLLSGGDAPAVYFSDAFGAVLMVTVFRKFGLLALMSQTFAWIVPALLTVDPSVWYFTRSLLIAGVVAAMAIYAFRVSVAAQPVFPLALAEED
ncbi:MAG TPA: serine/threonine-protein kinase [Thermoanaerobaculia bacterium]